MFYSKIQVIRIPGYHYTIPSNGPTIHKYLYSTILQITTWQISFTAATNKIYHELKVHPKIEYCNKFCEENPHMAQERYVLTTATSGTTSATYLQHITYSSLQKISQRIFPEHHNLKDQFLYQKWSVWSKVQGRVIQQEVEEKFWGWKSRNRYSAGK